MKFVKKKTVNVLKKHLSGLLTATPLKDRNFQAKHDVKIKTTS